MDLNRAMVELYKQRSLASKKKDLAGKRGNTNGDAVGSDAMVVDEAQAKKRAKIEEVIAEFNYKPKATFDQLHGCDTARDQVLKSVERFRRSIEGKAKKSEWPILVCGSRGLGKTSIVEAAANYANLKLIPIPLKTLVEKTRNEFKIIVKQLTRYCTSNQPAIVLVDDLDQISDKEDLRYLVRGAVRRVLSEDTNLMVFCTTSSISNDPSGLDFLMTIHLKRPDLDARHKILCQLRESNKNLTNLSDDCIKMLAVKTPSFTAQDLRKTLDIAETESEGFPDSAHCDKAIEVVRFSFKRGTHLIGEKPSVTWNDIGGLPEVRRAFVDILRQIRRGDVNCKFAGIALYGPPGCGKTMVAQAMANEAGLNFISIKPAELVDKFLGETEKNIRRVFNEAQEHEPCMIYFDEFDGLCGTRGNKDTVTSAIQTLLSEMDGFASRGKSIILVSTNRLEDIDPAMKRPGRLSKHIYVGPPDLSARLEILQVTTRKSHLTLSSDTDLEQWAKRTENFTGAELDFLVSEAEFRAATEIDVHDCDLEMDIGPTVLKHEHFEYAMNMIRTTNRELGKKIKKT